MRELLLPIAVLLTAVAIGLGVISSVSEQREIDRLRDRVACLEHPHQESSITAIRIHGKWHQSKPVLTGCR